MVERLKNKIKKKDKKIKEKKKKERIPLFSAPSSISREPGSELIRR